MTVIILICFNKWRHLCMDDVKDKDDKGKDDKKDDKKDN